MVVSSVNFTWVVVIARVEVVVAIALFDGKSVAGMVTVVVTDDGTRVEGVVMGCILTSATV